MVALHPSLDEDKVRYDCTDWLEKNKDELPEHLLEVIKVVH